jgi:hypothetical protein
MALVIGSIVAVVTAFLIGSGRTPDHVAADPGLTTVIRFMVLIKASVALGVALLVERRLRYPLSRPMVTAMILATAMALAGPALMWHLVNFRLGIAMFYAGVTTLGALAWTDRSEIGALLAEAVAQRRSRHP